MLSQLGITVPQGYQPAAAQRGGGDGHRQPAGFRTPGQRTGYVVSSVGNARSLRGGTLLMTPLKGADGRYLRHGPGQPARGGAGAQAGGSSVQINQQASGRIAGGAMVERRCRSTLAANGGMLELVAQGDGFRHRSASGRRSTWSLPVRWRRPSMGASFSPCRAPATPMRGSTSWRGWRTYGITPTRSAAKVVLNSRTGSVVMNGNVTLGQAAVAHGSLSIIIDTDFQVSQPNAFSAAARR